jgi:TonB family protein
MYFEIEDFKPDITPVGSAISWREGVLLSIIVHLLGVIVILMAPKWFPSVLSRPRPVRVAAVDRPQDRDRFVFVQPKVDLKALKPPPRAEASDQDREARSIQRAKEPTSPLPFSRGNTTERVEQAVQEPPKGPGATPEPPAGEPHAAVEPETPPAAEKPPLPPSNNALRFPDGRTLQNGAGGQRPLGGALGDALQNLQRYVQRDQFENPQGGGMFGPAIQFDTKGVEFGPWIRRFVTQVKRNWIIPYAAMSMKGHVVVTFNVHKDGTITDLQVVGPSPIGAFNNAAYGALASSNPTAALPSEYPSDKAFFTVTFFYNEEPQ